jgi:hypothetical protein
MNSLETLLTSVLTTLGIASPAVISAVKFVFKEYHRLRKAVDLILAIDARIDELDSRLKEAGIRDTDAIVAKHLKVLKGTVKEAFSRRDLRLDSVEHRVEVIKQDVQKTSPAGSIVLPETVSLLKKDTKSLGQRLQAIETALKFQENEQKETKKEIFQLQSREAPTPLPQESVADTNDIRQLKSDVQIIKRAVYKLGQRLKLDLSFELHLPIKKKVSPPIIPTVVESVPTSPTTTEPATTTPKVTPSLSRTKIKEAVQELVDENKELDQDFDFEGI